MTWSTVVWVLLILVIGPPVVDKSVDVVHKFQCKEAYDRLGLPLDTPFEQVRIADAAYAKKHGLVPHGGGIVPSSTSRLYTVPPRLYTVPPTCAYTSRVEDASSGVWLLSLVIDVAGWFSGYWGRVAKKFGLTVFEIVCRVLFAVLIIVLLVVVFLRLCEAGLVRLCCTKKRKKKRKKRSK